MLFGDDGVEVLVEAPVGDVEGFADGVERDKCRSCLGDRMLAGDVPRESRLAAAPSRLGPATGIVIIIIVVAVVVVVLYVCSSDDAYPKQVVARARDGLRVINRVYDSKIRFRHAPIRCALCSVFFSSLRIQWPNTMWISRLLGELRI